ncbi:MAG: hypothetical protein GX589_01090 [Deltaproteobacteria bacterium]|nr:hypothetical protein [Deltaproteobacteria bacterium]
MEGKSQEKSHFSDAVEIEIQIPGVMELAVLYGDFSMVQPHEFRLERALTAIRTNRLAPVQIYIREKVQ